MVERRDFQTAYDLVVPMDEVSAAVLSCPALGCPLPERPFANMFAALPWLSLCAHA
jgi:hypothetical protein